MAARVWRSCSSACGSSMASTNTDRGVAAGSNSSAWLRYPSRRLRRSVRSPSSACSSPARILSRVDLPDPLGADQAGPLAVVERDRDAGEQVAGAVGLGEVVAAEQHCPERSGKAAKAKGQAGTGANRTHAKGVGRSPAQPVQQGPASPGPDRGPSPARRPRPSAARRSAPAGRRRSGPGGPVRRPGRRRSPGDRGRVHSRRSGGQPPRPAWRRSQPACGPARTGSAGRSGRSRRACGVWPRRAALGSRLGSGKMAADAANPIRPHPA